LGWVGPLSLSVRSGCVPSNMSWACRAPAADLPAQLPEAFLRGQPARGTARVLDDVLTTSRFSGGGAGGVVGALFASRAVAAFAGVGGSVGGEAGGVVVRAVGLAGLRSAVDVPGAFELPHGRGD